MVAALGIAKAKAVIVEGEVVPLVVVQMIIKMSTCLVALRQVPEAQNPSHLMTARNLFFLPFFTFYAVCSSSMGEH